MLKAFELAEACLHELVEAVSRFAARLAHAEEALQRRLHLVLQLLPINLGSTKANCNGKQKQMRLAPEKAIQRRLHLVLWGMMALFVA